MKLLLLSLHGRGQELPWKGHDSDRNFLPFLRARTLPSHSKGKNLQPSKRAASPCPVPPRLEAPALLSRATRFHPKRTSPLHVALHFITPGIPSFQTPARMAPPPVGPSPQASGWGGHSLHILCLGCPMFPSMPRTPPGTTLERLPTTSSPRNSQVHWAAAPGGWSLQINLKDTALGAPQRC